MTRKTLLTLAVAAVAMSPAYAIAQSGSGPNQTNCQPMIQDAQAKLSRVSDDRTRGQIMETLEQARLELRRRNYDACVNTVQVALNQIERHGGEVPYNERIPGTERRAPESTFEQPAVPAPLEPRRNPNY